MLSSNIDVAKSDLLEWLVQEEVLTMEQMENILVRQKFEALSKLVFNLY